MARTAVGVADTLDRILFERIGDIQALAHDSVLRNGTPDAMAKRLREYRSLYGYYSWIAVMNRDGRVMADTGAVTTTPDDLVRSGLDVRGQDVSRQDWFQEVRRTRTVHVAEAWASPESGGAMAVGCSAPLLGTNVSLSTRSPVACRWKVCGPCWSKREGYGRGECTTGCW